jgi:hypothetical protein
LTLLAFGPYVGENVEHLLQKTHCTDRGEKTEETTRTPEVFKGKGMVIR